MTFGLLRLPRLALAVVIREVGFSDLICLTQTSRRMYFILTTTPVNSRPAHFEAVENDDPDDKSYVALSTPYDKILIYLELIEYRKPVRYWKFGDVYVAIGIINGNLVTYWEDKEQGFRRLFEFFRRITHLEMSYIVDVRYPEPAYNFMEYLGRSGIKLAKINWKTRTSSEEKSRNVLNLAANSKKLYFRSNLSEDFIYENFRFFTMEHLVFSNAKWIKLEHLYALMGCSRIDINAENLKSGDLRTFLLHWIEDPGEVRNWGISIGEDLNKKAVMMELPAREVEMDKIWHIRRGDGEIWEVELRRNMFILRCK